MRFSVAPPALTRIGPESGPDTTGGILNVFRRTRGMKIADVPGQDVGWNDWSSRFSSLFQGRRALPRSLADYLSTYGGTEDSVLLVYACAGYLASELASYSWHLETLDEDEVPADEVPIELRTLLRFPGPKLTWYRFVRNLVLDLELAGNSYWLKDNTNKFGQPGALMRLRPEKVRIAVNEAGLPIGYLYTVGALEIPYELDDVIHFKYDNPLDDLYGMGTVEAIQKDLDLDLKVGEHLVGFFEQGGRISGILTVERALSENQFQRMKQQVEQQQLEVGKFRMIIAEEGNSFTPITQAPAEIGVIELERMGKDKILTAFGVSEFLLGGVQEAGIYKMGMALEVMRRRNEPKKVFVEEQLTMDVVSLFVEGDVALKLDESAADSPDDIVDRAARMVGTGATGNELRAMQGLPTIDDDTLGPEGTNRFDMPLWSSGLVTMDQIVAPPPEEPLEGEIVEPELPPGGGEPAALPPGEETGESEPPTEEEISEDGAPVAGNRGVRPFGRKAVAVSVPPLPEGFEPLGPTVTVRTVEPAIAQDLIAEHVAAFRDLTPRFRAAFVSFFIGQRGRIMARVKRYDDTAKSSRGFTRKKGGRSWTTKDLRPQDIWSDEEEDRALRETFEELTDAAGRRATEGLGRVLGAQINWELENPEVAAVSGVLANRVVGINKTTKLKIADVIRDGLKRGYSIAQIANGYPEERYPGIVGVFDQATAARAETIARTETGTVLNAATLLGFAREGIAQVEVIDGIYWDDACREANGQTWDVAYAAAHPLEHPNCTRVFLPVVGLPDEVENTVDEVNPSSLFTMPERLPRRNESVVALRAIDGAHHLGPEFANLRRVKLRANRDQDAPFLFNPSEGTIDVRGGYGTPFDALRAFGHAFDFHVLGGGSYWASDEDDDFKAALPMTVVFGRVLHGITTSKITDLLLTDLDVTALLMPRLMPRYWWARGYAQWVSELTEIPQLIQAVQERATAGVLPDQWTPEDFAPIRDYFNSLAVSLGWQEPPDAG